MVDRGLHYYFVARLEEAVDNVSYALHDAWNVGDVVGIDMPLMAVVYPLCDGPRIVAWSLGISQQWVVEALAQRVDDERWSLPFHVGNPHGQQVGTSVVAQQVGMLYVVAARAVDDFVEVVSLHNPLC